MIPDISAVDFWQSKEVKAIIKAACNHNNWGISRDTETWEGLQHEIIRWNTKGDYIVPPPLVPPHGYCIDQVPFTRDDGSSTYTRFRYCLGVFVDLFVLLGRRVTECYGRDSWRRVSDLLIEDAENRRLVLLLRDITLAPRPSALNWLEQLSRKGMRIKWRAGYYSLLWSRDCGVGDLVTISTKMLTYLDQTKNNHMADSALIRPEERKRVIVDSNGAKLVRLRYLGKVLELRGMARELFLILFWEKNFLTFEHIWRKLFEPKTGKVYLQDLRGGPPSCMRSLKYTLNRALCRAFGRPPGRPFWVEDVKSHGYRLNRISAIWHEARDLDRPTYFPRDPRQIDGNPEDY